MRTTENSTLTLLIFGLVALSSIAKGQETTASPCTNTISDVVCQKLEKFGTCFSQIHRMQRWCPRTCGFCGEVCRDWFKLECRKWLRHQACFTHRDKMKIWCKKTCGFCRSASPPQPPECAKSPYGCCWDRQRPAQGLDMLGCGECEDRLLLCRAFWIDCYSERNQRFMYRNCPRTCLLCKPTENTMNTANPESIDVFSGLTNPEEPKLKNNIGKSK